ncbi:hypothetical protein F-LCD7_0497 [Faustovirus]|nr:hypothetical protein F-LCD7_0497 [Faustovirus]SMH63477.1 Hypothetical protein FSTVLC9_442 [Faustovirus]
MNNCVVPIEIIGVICEQNYGTWYPLIQTCWGAYRALYGRRWATKCAVLRPKIQYSTSYQMSTENAGYLRIKIRRGNIHRRLSVGFAKDYWVINTIDHMAGNTRYTVFMMSERCCGINWYKNGVLVCNYSESGEPGRRYRYVSTVSGYLRSDNTRWGTRAQIKDLLREYKVPDRWIDAPKHDN